jgi:hypothetical protein
VFFLFFGDIQKTVESIVPGDFVAGNRGADFIQHLAPALRARTKYWTGHRTPINQTASA